MERPMELDIVTEQNLALTARLLLIINRKQIALNSMNLDSSYSSGYHRYKLNLSGDLHMLNQAVKVISKQIGVFEVKASVKAMERVSNREMTFV